MKIDIPNTLIDGEKQFLHSAEKVCSSCSFSLKDNHIYTLTLAAEEHVQIPSEIKNLKHLKLMQLFRWKSALPLPLEIQELTMLNHLILESLNITGLPSNISKIPNLKILNIKSPMVTSVPDEIGNILTLEGLDIWGGFSELPEGIGKLINLRTLILTCKNLQRLPQTIGSLISLRSFNCHDSGIRTLPDTIGNCQNLEKIDLYNTLIEKLPETIGNLINLKELNISETKLVSIPASLGKCNSLEEVSLSNCLNLRDIPPSIAKLPKLRSFIPDNCPKLSLNSKGIMMDIDRLTEQNQKKRFRLTPEQLARLKNNKDQREQLAKLKFSK
jgi:Leucine-rich repeat (LRR) protein